MTTYILRQPDGSTLPPMSIDDLRRLATDGNISPEHNIQIQGGQMWHPASKVHGLVITQQSQIVPPTSNNPPTPSHQDSSPDKLDSVKNAGKNVQDQIAKKLPFVKAKLLSFKTTIMKSRKNMIITGSSVAALLLVLVVAFSGGGGIRGHLNAVKSATAQMVAAINSGNANGLLDSMEAAVLAFEDMQHDSVAIKTEIAAMNEYEKQAMQNEFMLVMRQNASALKPTGEMAIKLFTDISTNPAHLQRMQELQIRMQGATRNNPFE